MGFGRVSLLCFARTRHRPGRKLDRRRFPRALSGRTRERFGKSGEPFALDVETLSQRNCSVAVELAFRRRGESGGRNARVAETKSITSRAAKHLGFGESREQICRRNRAVQTRQRPGAIETARRGFL